MNTHAFPRSLVLLCAAVMVALLPGSGCPTDINVPTLNLAPIANAGPDETGFIGETITLNADASADEDGDPLSFEWSQTRGPRVDIADADQPQASFVARRAGVYEFVVTVEDGRGGSDQDTVKVSVSSAADEDPSKDTDEDGVPDSLDNCPSVANDDQADSDSDGKGDVCDSTPNGEDDPDKDDAPVAVAKADGPKAVVGDEITLDASDSSDPEGGELTFKWSQIEGPDAALDDETNVTTTFVAEEAGDYAFLLTVTDLAGNTSTDTIRIRVREESDEPDDDLFIEGNWTGTVEVSGELFDFEGNSTPIDPFEDAFDVDILGGVVTFYLNTHNDDDGDDIIYSVEAVGDEVFFETSDATVYMEVQEIVVNEGEAYLQFYVERIDEAGVYIGTDEIYLEAASETELIYAEYFSFDLLDADTFEAILSGYLKSFGVLDAADF